MKKFDAVGFGKYIAELAKAYIDRRLAEVDARMNVALANAKGEPGAQGERGEAGPQGEPGARGADAVVDEAVLQRAVDARLAAMFDGHLEKLLARLPKADAIHPDTMRLTVVEEVGKAVGILPRAQDGKSVTIEEVRPVLEEMVARAVGAIPKPKDGAPGERGEPGPVGPQGERGEVGPAGPPGPQGEKGADGAPGAQGERGIDGAAGPQGERGEQGEPGPAGAAGERGPAGEKGATGERGEAGPRGEQGERGADGARGEQGPEGERGADGAPGLRGEAGPTGERGEKGADGQGVDLAIVRDIVGLAVKAAVAEIPVPTLDMDELERVIRRRVEDELAAWPRPKDGADGLGLGDLSLDLKEDGRTLVFKFANGERERTFEILCPWQIHRGVFQSGKPYQKGDTVTYAGSQYTAIRDTTDKPPKSPDWQLAVKSGKDAA